MPNIKYKFHIHRSPQLGFFIDSNNEDITGNIVNKYKNSTYIFSDSLYSRTSNILPPSFCITFNQFHTEQYTDLIYPPSNEYLNNDILLLEYLLYSYGYGIGEIRFYRTLIRVRV